MLTKVFSASWMKYLEGLEGDISECRDYNLLLELWEIFFPGFKFFLLNFQNNYNEQVLLL